jgi:hypothetical protein
MLFYLILSVFMNLQSNNGILKSEQYIYFSKRPTARPSRDPRIAVIIAIGTRIKGCFQPMMKAEGNRNKKETSRPFITGGSFNSEVERKKPATTHLKNAERSASKVNFCSTMGTTSIIPAIAPNRIPTAVFFFMIITLDERIAGSLLHGISIILITYMPRISEFFGILIYMYFSEHSPPHFHALYGDFEASFTIDTLEILEGSLPRRVIALVLEWAALHRTELRNDWEQARQGKALDPISPLE